LDNYHFSGKGVEMKRSDLAAMTVAELKALAKKKKVSLPARGTKAELIDAMMAVPKAKEPAAKKTAASAKPAAKKTVKAKKSSKAKKPTVKKRAAKKMPSVETPVHEWKLPPGLEEPLMAQERVSESKYYTGPAQQPAAATYGELPNEYGEEKIALMTRDPFVAYAYWEATSSRIEREKAWFGLESKLCVRIYDITGVQFDGRNAIGYFDQEVYERVGNWYFDFGRPTHSFCADLGLLSPEGRFLTLARSNYVTMPRDGVSDVIDEEWMLVDEEFWKLYGYAEGVHSGSSPGISEKEMMRRRRLRMQAQAISSPGMFSPGWSKRK
jgi:hypothetical protein